MHVLSTQYLHNLAILQWKRTVQVKAIHVLFWHLTETTLLHRDFREANFYYVLEINACTFFTIVLIFEINIPFGCIYNQITSFIVT